MVHEFDISMKHMVKQLTAARRLQAQSILLKNMYDGKKTQYEKVQDFEEEAAWIVIS